MIELTKKIGKKTEVIKVAENWQEVYYQSYVDMMKNNVLQIEDDTERSLKVIATVSSDPVKCEEWIREMPIDSFKELIESMSFTNFTDLPISKKTFIKIGTKKYKIKTDFDSITWGGQTSFERLKEEYKGTEDFVLALGVLLIEVDSKGKEIPFDILSFDYAVNNLPDKVLMVDIFQHVNFFLSGVKKQSLKDLPSFIIKKVTK